MLFDEIFLPPRLQALTGLDNVLRKPISLGCKELFGATEHFAFGRYRRTGQGIKGVAVEVGNVEEGIVERERNAAAPLLRRLEPESESESMIGGSEVYSHRKSRKMG